MGTRTVNKITHNHAGRSKVRLWSTPQLGQWECSDGKAGKAIGLHRGLNSLIPDLRETFQHLSLYRFVHQFARSW